MIIATALLWWLLLQLFGLVGLPLSFRLFGNLPDRGYAFARPLGLMLTGYVLWLGGSLGFWQSGVSATLVAMASVFGAGLWLYFSRRGRDAVSLLAWLRGHLAYVLSVELLFGLAVIGWAVFRAHNPNIETAGGEKWMEIAFVNSILRSESFPPQDPWLSGFGISYYYFGYVLMAMVARLSGLGATVAYTLFVPGLFALTLSGAFSLVYNLVVGRLQSSKGDKAGDPAAGPGIRYGVLGAVFVGVIGNLEGLLEVLHSRGLLAAGFWRWLDIKDINGPAAAGAWIPERFRWWWRASRVIHDCSFQGLLTGNCNPPGGDWEVIDEFPFFSFLLGDVHPHVLALPFVLLGLTLALNVTFGVTRARSGGAPASRGSGDGSVAAAGSSAAGIVAQICSGFRLVVDSMFGGRFEFLVVAVCLGALGFLNTWDFPIYLGVLTAALALARAQCGSSAWLVEAAVMGAGLGLLGGVLYAPFYVGFQSQAGGVLPNLFNPTRLQQFLVFFGPFLFVVATYLILLSRQSPDRDRLRRLPMALGVAIAGPLLAMLFLLAAAAVLPSSRQMVNELLRNTDVQPLLGQATLGSLVILALRIRMTNPLTFLFLGGLLAWVALLWPAGEGRERSSQRAAIGSSDRFALIMIGMGVFLPLVVEFIYLRDNFGIRMNTVFKFYVQAWVLLALAAAYGVSVAVQSLRGWGGVVWRLALALLVVGGLIYPLLAIPSKIAGYADAPTLDGMEWLQRDHPDDYEAIRWLQANVSGDPVILEAPGDHYAAYDYVARVSAMTGLPTLLGWGNHENQWRGSYAEAAQREPDIEALYNGLDARRTTDLLDKYGIEYVYVGDLERQRYDPEGLAKFETLMEVAYQRGGVTIYERR